MVVCKTVNWVRYNIYKIVYRQKIESVTKNPVLAYPGVLHATPDRGHWIYRSNSSRLSVIFDYVRACLRNVG